MALAIIPAGERRAIAVLASAGELGALSPHTEDEALARSRWVSVKASSHSISSQRPTRAGRCDDRRIVVGSPVGDAFRWLISRS